MSDIFNITNAVITIITLAYAFIFVILKVIRKIEPLVDSDVRMYSAMKLSYKQAKIWGWYKLFYYYLFNSVSSINYSTDYHPTIEAIIRNEIKYHSSTPIGAKLIDREEIRLSTYDVNVRLSQSTITLDKLNSESRYGGYLRVNLSPSCIILLVKLLKTLNKKEAMKKNNSEKNKLFE